jgi:hypothetical protein
MEPKHTTTRTNSDLEFIQDLRECVARYLQAVDAWEAGYQKFYRLARPQQRVSPDLEEAQSEYGAARRELESLVPRARRLCAKFDLRDLWPGLLRIELGAHPPQVRIASAFGRSERIAIADCLANLELRCGELEAKAESIVIEDALVERPPRNLLQRIIDHFI